jgi:glutathione synthase/RimK-type ligase-like ATP-grasp enzyme
MNYKQFFEKIDFMSKESGRSKISILVDVVISGFKYSSGYMDYYLFRFHKLPHEKRITYLTRGKNNEIVKMLNSAEESKKFASKSAFNESFQEYIGREWINFAKCSKEEFIKWIESKDCVFIKPQVGCGGSGVKKVKIKEKDLDSLYENFRSNNIGIIETCLAQHPLMSKLYQDSINTLRIATVVDDFNNVDVIYTFVRIGNGGDVDNFNSGGMSAKIDSVTGEIITEAIDKDSNTFGTHPITGVNILGYTIPLWDEAIDLVKKAALVVPKVRYVGWDVAITPNGPVLVEGNEYPGNDLTQMSIFIDNQEGILPLFDKYIN